jgi:hypothetical protein
VLPGLGVILHDAAKRALGAFLPAQNQPRGTCTSRGLKRHLDLQQCSRIAGGEPLAFHEVNHAIIYGLGREIAGMLGGNPNDQNDDGCTGAAVARGAVKGGELRYEDTTEPTDNRDDDRLACLFGARGVPQGYKDAAALHRAKDVAQVTTLASARLAAVNGYGFTVASTVGFEPFRRNADGFCRPGGSWPHQMCCTGYRVDKDWFLIDQSWGPDQPPGPIGDIDIPPYSFWVDAAAMTKMLSMQDAWVVSTFDGWPSDLTLRWLI